jgi:hypothetical protein
MEVTFAIHRRIVGKRAQEEQARFARTEPASRVERVRILLAYWEDPAAPAALET